MTVPYIFIGGTYRGYRLAKHLIEAEGQLPDYMVILKEDEHEALKYSPQLIALAEAHQIPYGVRKKLNAQDMEVIREKKRAFAVVCGWRTLIDPELGNYLEYGLLGAHDSLLPKYRGFAPLNWAILQGERVTGVTLFEIGEGDVDTGRILAQETVAIGPEEYAAQVYEKITDATIKLYVDFIENYRNGTVTYTEQNDDEATYTCKRTPEDGKIDWTKPAAKVHNLIRALAPPYPGAFCTFGDKQYVVCEAGLGPQNEKKFVAYIPGRVLKVDPSGIEVMCGEGTLWLSQWQEKGTENSEVPSSSVKSITVTLK